ncbi:MAG: 16S rRNA (cytosine(967)-C(5))-methyltransferase RsmB [Nitrospiraceae bacterium]|nr:16S rRNA (cytosine(967)-C(5))-methyltransferase RsmB [Nitrospiraceae bacterium]
MFPTRSLAIQALTDIFSRSARPKAALAALAGGLDKRDRAFLTEIVYGVTRYRDTLDWVLGRYMKNPSKPGAFTQNNLRAAVYQIYFMRVPDWAAVNEAVEMEKSSSSPGKASLVNAVLRSVLRNKDRVSHPFPFDDPADRIAINTSHPKWLVKRWLGRFGEEEARRLAEANNRVPPLTIRVNTLRTTREDLISLLVSHGAACVPTEFSPDGIVLKEVRSHEELSFADGLFAVQDEASQLISYLLDPRPGETVLDGCAAPGGKTTHIAQLMRDSGLIVAVEKDGERIDMLRANLRDLGVTSVTIVQGDVAQMRGAGPFDRILLDAPCSATGVIRRNPDVKYRRKARDLADYKANQMGLLRAAASLLKEGGRLVYSVCSLEPEEGEEVAHEFLKTAAEFRIIDAEAVFVRQFSAQGFVRTYPHRHTMDGFFGVAVCKGK